MNKRLLIRFGALVVLGVGLGMLLRLSWGLSLRGFRTSEDDHAHVEAIKALGRLGPAAVPELCEKLEHPDPRVRREAAILPGGTRAIAADA